MIAEAILELVPNAQFKVIGDQIEWLNDATPPDEEDVVQKIAELKYLEEVNEYKMIRENAYPSSGEQFDQIFHDGIDAWKATIQAIKDAHPKAEVDLIVLEERKSQALFAFRLQKYKEAIQRLSQYRLADGQTEVTQDVISELDDAELNEDGNKIPVTVVTQTSVDALPSTITVSEYDEELEEIVEKEIPNPAIVKDDEERAAAQAVIDATPQEVINAYNAEV